MKSERLMIEDRDVFLYNGMNSEYLLLQLVDDNDAETLEDEVKYIEEMSTAPFTLAAYKIFDWNIELAPWGNSLAFRNAEGAGADRTLDFVMNTFVPAVIDRYSLDPDITIIAGGYTLSAFFGLWAGYQTSRITSIAAATPTIWMPGWLDYSRDNEMRAVSVYLSRGTKDEIRHTNMQETVGEYIQDQYRILTDELGHDNCIIEWNEGGHFNDLDMRGAKAFSWCINHLEE